MRVGLGFDIHQTDVRRPLVLGGVTIDSPFGLKGHSDADVLTHAIIDALLGAAALGDIGEFFSDTDAKNLNRSSLDILSETVKMLREKGYFVVNIDATIIAEKPKLMDYKSQMILCLSSCLQVRKSCVNVKAKTHEKIGPLGRSEAIEAQAIVLIDKEKNI
ncbi:2-C-methyl-D-erythritol 2,4-cyclodiphosphate synthase [PVC group bacterium (ex Bugula neritina AB1)]|nr:2-C-methyl-D-erythritol 2,4-cyclodiphosphate synthase [PVC group bacterium (ex Bugula neritina AB1)]